MGTCDNRDLERMIDKGWRATRPNMPSVWSLPSRNKHQRIIRKRARIHTHTFALGGRRRGQPHKPPPRACALGKERRAIHTGAANALWRY